MHIKPLHVNGTGIIQNAAKDHTVTVGIQQACLVPKSKRKQALKVIV